MRVFLYDSSFEGLLTAIYDAYYSKVKPEKIYSKGIYEFNLIDEVVNIETDIIKFQKVYNAIENKISRNSLNKIFYVYLSEEKESGNIIYAYVRMGFNLGKDVELHKNNDIVISIDKISKRVSYEKHRLTGFVRFREVNNILYSTISPDFNILPIIGNHFEARFSNEYFIIHDTKRDIALIYDRKNYYLSKLTNQQKEILKYDSDNGDYENLWKIYFECINIKERENIKLQKRQMPTRYWRNMLEVNDNN